MARFKPLMFSGSVKLLLVTFFLLNPAYSGLQVNYAHAGFNDWKGVGPDGGRMLALAMNPVNPAVLYAGTDGGGVFKSANGGANWYAVNNGLTNLQVQGLAIDPMNPEILYAGTDGEGIFKSTDGGASWQPVNSGLTQNRAGIFAIHPQNPRHPVCWSDKCSVQERGRWGKLELR